MTGPRRLRSTVLHDATALLVGVPTRRASEAPALRAVLASGSDDVWLESWRRERVVVLAADGARELGAARPAWDAAADAERHHARSVAGLSDLVTIQASRVLSAGGIPCVTLKGGGLARRLYGDPGRRSASQDIDLLVPTAHLDNAAARLMELGMQAPEDPRQRNGLPIHHLTLRAPGDGPTIELHWRLQWYDDAQAARLLARAEPSGDGLAVLEPVDLLGMLGLMWAKDGFHTLRLAADIAGWWQVYGASHGTQVDRLCHEPVLGRTHRIAAAAAARVVGTPAPDRATSDAAARLAVAIARSDRPRGRRPGGPSQQALVDVLVCPPELRRRRFSESWLLDPNVSSAAHPWAPSAVVPLLRSVSAARTAVDAVPITARALALGRRRVSPR